MSKFQKKVKIWDIVPKSPLGFKSVSQPKPKRIFPMADIVISRTVDKFSESRSFFFFSLGQLLIPRLLPRFLALFLAALLVMAPVWTVLAEALNQKENQESGVMNQEEIASNEAMKSTLELTPSPLPKSEIQLPITTEKELSTLDKNIENINEENPRENEEETVQEENQESGVMNQEEIASNGSESSTAEVAPSIESEVMEPKTELEVEFPTTEEELPEAEKEATAEEDLNKEDIYEQIRRNLDSEWRSKLEAYRQKFEITEEELRRQKELWNESLEQKLKEEIKKELDQKCVKLEETGYYCLAGEAGKTDSAASQPTNFNASNENFPVAPKEIFSLKDPEKNNREIYLKEKNGISRRLTNNDYDDLFPALDILGNSAVWQTLIAGRWQIFFYDLSSQKTIQLTNSDSNNMNPQINNNRVIWQAWIDGNWEIYLASQNSKSLGNCDLEIENSNDCWLIQRLTNNYWHDMFPKIAGDLATWQVFKNNLWQLAVYNLKTGSLTSLNRGEERAENPRFAVLWESRQAGQRKYFAYDLSSGELTEIRPGNEESPTPLNLPDIPSMQGALTVPATSSPTRPDGLADEDL